MAIIEAFSARGEAMNWRKTGDRSALAVLTIGVLAVISVFAVLVSVANGAADTSVFTVARAILTGDADGALSLRDRVIIFDIRLPRALMGFLVGASLAVCGTAMQGLFRNPLADPALVGVSAGSGLGAVIMIVLGGTVAAPLYSLLGFYALPAAAFVGGLATSLILYKVATRNGETSVATMLLAGIALSALTGAATGFLVYLANDQQLRDLTFWSMGSLAGATWTKIFAIAPVMLATFLVLPFMARGLNAITLGEATAFHIGIPVQRLKHVTIIAVSAATGSAVAVSGGIGFVGIVVPHLLRLVIGPDNRYLLPASALLGGSLLVLADVLARTIVAPAELPIGIITAVAGGPFFMWILLKNRSRLNL